MLFSKRQARISPSIAIGWFLGWWPLLSAFAGLTNFPIEVDMSVFVVGTIFWLASCYWVYDTLFMMAEARWPEVKGIRELISLLVRTFVRSHHSP